MHPWHLIVSVVNILCGISAYLGIYVFEEYLGQIGGIMVIFGYFANLIALIISFVLIIVLTARAFKHKHRPFFSNNWLGIFNGLFVISNTLYLFNSYLFI